jgi:3-hydroxyacyl-CoA dehydrogenase
MVTSKITVLGSGTMGAGIAQVAAASGFETILCDITDEILGAAMQRIRGRLDRATKRAKITEDHAAATLERLTPVADFETAVSEADFLIEAIPEKLDLKREAFQKAERLAPAHCVLGTQ